MEDREQYRERIRKSGLEVSGDKMEKMIDIVLYISKVSGVSVEQALNNMLGFMTTTVR